jgi:hypothetical protein
MAVHSRRAVAFCGPQALAERRGLQLGVADQLPQPQYRPAAAELRSHLLRRQAGHRSLHQAVLAERERAGSGGHGRDAGGWRRQSRHQAARGRCGGLSLCADGDDYGRLVRDLGRLAL